MERSISHLDLGRIAASGQCFTWRALPGGGWGIPFAGHYVEASQQGDRLHFSCSEAEFDQIWADYFDLGTDYAALAASVDPADGCLTAAFQEYAGLRVLRQDFWEVLVSFLISQNNNIGRITGSVRALCERWGGKYAFPTPEVLAGVPEEALRAAGLGYRAKYLSRLSRELSGGGLADLRRTLDSCTDQEAERTLMGLYGVGKKVADCICLFGLHRADFFPVDTHIRQILDRAYPGGFPYERYRGRLGIVQQYLFCLDLGEKRR